MHLDGQRKLQDIWKGYGRIGMISFLIGFDFKTRSRKKLFKILQYVYPLLLHVNLIYMITFWKILLEFSLQMTFAVLLMCIIVTVAWYVAKVKIKKIRTFLFRLNVVQQYIGVTRSRCIKINLILAYVTIFPVFIAIISVYFLQFAQQNYQLLFSFNCTIQSKIIVYLVNLFVLVTYFISCYQFPAILTILTCAIYHRLSDLIFEFSCKVKRLGKQPLTTKDLIEVFHQFSRILDLADEVENILSPLTFLLLCILVLSEISALITVVMFGSRSLDTVYLMELSVNLSMPLLGTIALIISAYMIPKHFGDIKTNLSHILETIIYFNGTDVVAVDLVRHMIQTNSPVMTAWSVVQLTPGLILSMLGGSLTFGLLLINLFQNRY